MDRIRRQDLEALLDHHAGPCVSIYLPLQPGGRDGQEDDTKLRKQADRAEELLVERGMRRPDARALLEPVRALPDDAAAWQKRGKALAIFAAPDMQRVFHTGGQYETALFVDDEFHLRQLLPMVTGNDAFFLLALSKNSARLFSGNSLGLEPLDVPGLPANRRQALHLEKLQVGLQSSPRPRGEVVKPQLPDQGPARLETYREDHRTFVYHIAQVIDRRLAEERAPLVLATDVSNVPLWKEASRYPYLTDAFVNGGPDHLSPNELHAKAWPLIEQGLIAEREALHQRIYERENPRSSFGLAFVVAAAIRGQVDSLFIDCSRPWWGMYDAENDTVFVHPKAQPGDRDLVELAAVATLRHGGRVYAINSEHANPDAAAQALLRY